LLPSPAEDGTVGDDVEDTWKSLPKRVSRELWVELIFLTFPQCAPMWQRACYAPSANTADNLLRALYEPTRELTLNVSWLQVKSDM
jgi:hypothetical protein